MVTLTTFLWRGFQYRIQTMVMLAHLNCPMTHLPPGVCPSCWVDSAWSQLGQFSQVPSPQEHLSDLGLAVEGQCCSMWQLKTDHCPQWSHRHHGSWGQPSGYWVSFCHLSWRIYHLDYTSCYNLSFSDLWWYWWLTVALTAASMPAPPTKATAAFSSYVKIRPQASLS